jgi:hypothetical protein
VPHLPAVLESRDFSSIFNIAKAREAGIGSENPHVVIPDYRISHRERCIFSSLSPVTPTFIPFLHPIPDRHSKMLAGCNQVKDGG